MKSKLRILFFLFFCFLPFSVLFADELSEPNIKWLRIFIRADVNEVHFRNFWVFERQTANGPWEASIDVPDRAVPFGFDEPNETELSAETGCIHKRMTADSLIDSVGFSFALPNQGRMCQTLIKPGYRVSSMVVYVSGPATQLISDVLKFDEFMASHSRFSGVYTAGNLPAGAKVEINLKGLPGRDCQFYEIVCVVGLVLIIIIALFTLYCKRRAI